MADRNGRIGVEQHHRNRFAQYRAASNHDGVFAAYYDSIVTEQPHNAGRQTRSGMSGCWKLERKISQ